MSSSISVTVRMILMLAFLAAMPVLALPVVNEWLDDQLLGLASHATATASPSSTVTADADAHRKTLPGPLRKPVDRAALPAPLTPVEKDGEPLLAKAFSRLPPTEPQVDAVRYAAVQQRLQELGADYFVLEKSLDATPSYRFHCRIAVPGSAVYTRPFEVHDPDPFRAMERTLVDVESWCASQHTGRRTLR